MTANVSTLKKLLNIDSEDTSEDSLLSVYLEIAEDKVLQRLYPFKSGTSVPSKYTSKVLSIAEYLYLRRGSEGETSHSENGVSRTYEDGDIPDSMLSDIAPFVGGVGS